MYFIQLPIATYRQHAVMFKYPCTVTQHHVHVTGTSEDSGTMYGVALVYTHVTGASKASGACRSSFSERSYLKIHYARVFINASVSWWRISGVSRAVVLNVVIPTVMMIMFV